LVAVGVPTGGSGIAGSVVHGTSVRVKTGEHPVGVTTGELAGWVGSGELAVWVRSG
jgi:hypothetical protein